MFIDHRHVYSHSHSHHFMAAPPLPPMVLIMPAMTAPLLVPEGFGFRHVSGTVFYPMPWAPAADELPPPPPYSETVLEVPPVLHDGGHHHDDDASASQPPPEP
jgi:hypothetical protein